jgi:hypothetical protein
LKSMNRNIVYPSSIPLDTDILSINRNTMVALGFLAQAILGSKISVDGLACQPTTPGSMSVTVGPGSFTQFAPIDASAYGSLPADNLDYIVKMAINTNSVKFTFTPPASSGQSINYLIQAAFQEADEQPIVLPYYNASNPSQSFSGPLNTGSAQNTVRTQRVQLQIKPGAAANTGSQVTPAPDSGWIALYQVTVAFGQTLISSANITVIPTAPFLTWKLPSLRPGFGSGVQSFMASGTFLVPAGVTQVEVEVWGGGSGSFASVANSSNGGGSGSPSGGGSGGGYAKKLVSNLTPGQVVAVTVGAGGTGGTVGGIAAQAGGASAFGQFVSASGGSLNPLATAFSPQNGATPAGVGLGGDVNFKGSAGQAAILNQGGMGGAAPMGGAQNSGTTGNPGTFPGGGASGAGTGANSATPYDGAAGGGGLVVVRW